MSGDQKMTVWVTALIAIPIMIVWLTYLALSHIETVTALENGYELEREGGTIWTRWVKK